jgi:hypothetical protein
MDKNQTLFASLFAGRSDAFGILTDGRPYAVRTTLTLRHYGHHLAGRLRLGVYPLLSDGTTRLLALDFDGPTSHDDAWRVYCRASHFKLPFLWEVSKSGDVHLWLFFSAPVLSRDIRRVSRLLLEEAGVRAEINPKQDQLSNGVLGNYIFLPLAGQSVPEGRTLFIDTNTGAPFPDQWEILKNVPRVEPEWIAYLVEANSLEDPSPAAPPAESNQPRVYSGDLLPCAVKMLKGVGEGCRDVVTFRLAIHFKAKGCSREETEQYLRDWNEHLNRPPLPRERVTQKVRSAFERGYTGYGCEDSLIIPFCDPGCPIKRKEETNQEVRNEKRKNPNRNNQDLHIQKKNKIDSHTGTKSGVSRLLSQVPRRQGWGDGRSRLGVA